MGRPLCRIEDCNNLARKARKAPGKFEKYCTKHNCSPEVYLKKRMNDKGTHWRAFKKDYCESADCGWTGEVIFQMLDVDHIDGDKNNNDPSNLITLCANCHRLKTWRSKEYLATKYRIKPSTL